MNKKQMSLYEAVQHLHEQDFEVELPTTPQERRKMFNQFMIRGLRWAILILAWIIFGFMLAVALVK